MKEKIAFECSSCSSIYAKWSGQCEKCLTWNSLVEVIAPQRPRHLSGGYAANKASKPVLLDEIESIQEPRISSKISELDRVLGGGIVVGSVTLIGGDPGIGKSTLLLQMLSCLSQVMSTLYITGEESPQQIKLRADRLGLCSPKMLLLAETNIECIMKLAKEHQPTIMIIDSIQTMLTEYVQSAPGGMGQVKECAAQLVRFAKHHHLSLFLVGHVTKEGTLAGPRVLEHMVDTVLYFEGEAESRFRIIRTVKNRFGAVNELGIFAMSEKGLSGIQNPSAIFLSKYNFPASGSIVMVTWEGTRPLLVEVQALVDESHLANPRRVTVGLDANRLAIVLAVLNRHGDVRTYNQDVFINIVGGVKVNETAADLPVLLAVLSSLKNKPLSSALIVFGEVGLAGEIRPIQHGVERLKEAAKHGFSKAIVAKANVPKKSIQGLEIIGIERLAQALEVCFD